jgi:uncharacterized membrane protein
VKKKLETIIFFIPRLIIVATIAIIKPIKFIDKIDFLIIIGLLSLFYGAFVICPPLAFIILGLIFLKLAGL